MVSDTTERKAAETILTAERNLACCLAVARSQSCSCRSFAAFRRSLVRFSNPYPVSYTSLLCPPARRIDAGPFPTCYLAACGDRNMRYCDVARLVPRTLGVACLLLASDLPGADNSSSRPGRSSTPGKDGCGGEKGFQGEASPPPINGPLRRTQSPGQEGPPAGCR